MDKPFRTIDEQIDILRSRGLAVGDDARSLLMREGYYSIVNGYKAPFLDREATRRAGEDRYLGGASLSDMHSLFLFDRDLREVTFHYIVKIESLVKTTCAYTFSESHRQPDDYLKQSSFATADEYAAFGLKGYLYNIQKLQGTLLDKATKSGRAPLKHYRETHGWVPLWVLSHDLTFGNIEHFFNLMKPGEQARVCKRISEATGRLGGASGFFGPKEARVGMDVIVKVRNMCAHDERLYCARLGKRGELSYSNFFGYASRYLTDEEVGRFSREIARIVVLRSGESEIVSHILMEMGFDKVGHARRS